MNYNNRKFRTVKNSDIGETSNETIFQYYQKDHILTSQYEGRKIIKGYLLGLVDKAGNIEMRYHQINTKGKLMTGVCQSRPEVLSNRKIRLYENWKWTSGNKSSGKSVIEEI